MQEFRTVLDFLDRDKCVWGTTEKIEGGNPRLISWRSEDQVLQFNVVLEFHGWKSEHFKGNSEEISPSNPNA